MWKNNIRFKFFNLKKERKKKEKRKKGKLHRTEKAQNRDRGL